MQIQTTFDAIANKYSEDYNKYLQNILATYNRTILQSNLNYKAIATFKNDLSNLNRDYVESLSSNIEDTYSQLGALVAEANEPYPIKVLEQPEWYDYLIDNAMFAFEIIKLQSVKDNLYAVNFLRNKTLQIMKMNDYKAAYELVYGKNELNFFYTDKIGRRVNSVKYIRTIIRDFLVKNYNDLLIGIATLNELEYVHISNIDEKHKDNNQRLGVDSNYSDYYKIRDDVFHPNTNSIIRLG